MLYAVHGFLGLTSDWKGTNTHSVDIYQFGNPSPSFGLQDWARAFNHHVKDDGEKRIVMGYSLGGRLALHALLDNPTIWSGAILISTHPGLKSENEKAERTVQDHAWAERFLNEEWNSLMLDWNRNDVFGGKSLQRKENDYSRAMLADVLKHWSLAKQSDLSDDIAKLHLPILCIAGENDSRYAALARAMPLLHSKSRTWIAPEAGHRVPWEAPEEFKTQIHTFIEDLWQ